MVAQSARGGDRNGLNPPTLTNRSPPSSTDPNKLKMMINSDKISRAGDGYAQHEKFTLIDDNNGNNPTAMQRLQTLFDTTNAKLAAGTCGTPTLTP
jgi:hypothetical protein